ncbi:TPA: multidrug ABC transporter ATP-binding protein [bacterium]|nr:multidrug ABC transporter ATP-binding protein [bacterium]
MIKVENVTKRFGNITALNNISFEVKKGDVLGFLGPNAAGKTTTMRVISCFISPSSGWVDVCGYDIHKEPFMVKKNIGYLGETTPLYLDMEAYSFLSFICDIRGIHNKEKRIREIADICGISSSLRRRIGELSRGIRQRVGLASVLVHDPPVLILDEPTSGLDPIQITQIRSLIQELAKEKTIIFSTHILSEASYVCNSVVIINKGEIVGSGTIGEITQNGELSLEEAFLKLASK